MPDCGPICLPGCLVVHGVDFARAPCDCRGSDAAVVTTGLGPDQWLSLSGVLCRRVSRPRKTLDWRTPWEVYAEVLNKSVAGPGTLQ